MYGKVLIPLDGSAFAERVQAHLQPLIVPGETELILLRVVEPLSYSVSPEAFAAMGGMDEALRWDEAKVYLDGVRGEWRELGFRTHMEVSGGEVATAIARSAEVHGADLIAITTHGRSGLGRWAYGSVADRVIRSATQPIFLVRGTSEVPPERTIRRILVPLDGSELAEMALEPAKSMAKEMGAEILLVRAVAPLSETEVAALYTGWGSADEVYSRRQTAATQYLGRVQRDLKAEGLKGATFVDEGHPAQVIVETEASHEADMVVMSTHGRSGVARWVYGSVADKVLRRAQSPLLLVRSLPGEAAPPDD
ncbi:MAG: universal stress protein [Anaerolineae bacterium]